MSVNKATGEELTNMMIKLGRLSFIILMYVFGAFLLFGEQFINLWVGGGELEGSLRYNIHECREIFIIALMIMIGYTLPLLQAFGNSLLEAKNKVSYKAIVYLIFMILGTIIGSILSNKYGAIGMATGLVFAWLIAQNIMNFYYHNEIGLNIIRFFKEILNKSLLIVIIAFAIGYIINYLPGFGWINFLIKALLYSILFSVLMFFGGMKNDEKEIFIKPINKLLKK